MRQIGAIVTAGPWLIADWRPRTGTELCTRNGAYQRRLIGAEVRMSRQIVGYGAVDCVLVGGTRE